MNEAVVTFDWKMKFLPFYPNMSQSQRYGLKGYPVGGFMLTFRRKPDENDPGDLNPDELITKNEFYLFTTEDKAEDWWSQCNAIMAFAAEVKKAHPETPGKQCRRTEPCLHKPYGWPSI